MKKNLLIAAIAITALASCSSNDYVGDQSPQPQGSNEIVGAIGFNLSTAAITRASGATAAGALDNQFIIWGEKNESGGTEASSGNKVFINYQVNWVDLANSTTSNTKGWEYVGYTHSNTASTDDYQTNITPHLGVAQEIKYWDMSATNYVFTAVSALKNDIKTGKIQISKTLSGTDAYAKGYTITAAADADFDHLYFADRNIVTSGYGTSPVTMNFRNLLSHIRVGIYETIPGYAVSSIKFYSTNFEAANEFKTTGSTPESIFGATVDNLKPGANTLTVTYNSANNKPVVSTSGTRATTITLGQNFNTLSTSSVMATSSATPTWETSGGAYTKVFPREGVTTDLTLKVKYTLYNSASGETMDITGTAVVPGEYLQWRPNYKYSYIFKLTDDDLTPITFDAVQVETETGSIEYITTVDDYAITTYQNGSTVTSTNEYAKDKTIYVVVGDGQALKTSGGGSELLSSLYTAVAQNGYIEGVTEATVANAIANGTNGWFETTPANGTSLVGYYTRSGDNPYTYTINTSGTADGSTKYYLPTKTLTDANSKTLTVTNAVGLETFTTIPAADSPTGADLTINGAKFTPTAAGNYVFEYVGSDSKKHYKVIVVK